MMLLTLGLKGESKSSSRNYESLEKKVEFSFRNSAKSQFVEFVSINLEICKRGLSTVDHSVAYFKSSWSEFRPAADLSSIPRFLAVACSWACSMQLLACKEPCHRSPNSHKEAGFGIARKVREDKESCRCLQSKTWVLSNWGDKSQSQWEDVAQSSCV